MNKQLANHIANRVLHEQIMPDATRKAQQAMGWTDTQIKTQQDKRAKERNASITNFWDEYKHEIVQVAAFAALMTGVGAPLYAALQVVDAGMYVAEGDREGAMLTVGFAMLPGVGKIGKSLAVRALGEKGMAKLGAKIARSKATKRLVLSKAEKAAFKVISANKEEAAQIIRAGAKRLAASKGGQAAGFVAKGVKGAGKLAKNAGKNIAQDMAVSSAVNKLYTTLGWEAADIAAQVRGVEILARLK